MATGYFAGSSTSIPDWTSTTNWRLAPTGTTNVSAVPGAGDIAYFGRDGATVNRPIGTGTARRVIGSVATRTVPASIVAGTNATASTSLDLAVGSAITAVAGITSPQGYGIDIGTPQTSPGGTAYTSASRRLRVELTGAELVVTADAPISFENGISGSTVLSKYGSSSLTINDAVNESNYSGHIDTYAGSTTVAVNAMRLIPSNKWVSARDSSVFTVNGNFAAGEGVPYLSLASGANTPTINNISGNQLATLNAFTYVTISGTSLISGTGTAALKSTHNQQVRWTIDNTWLATSSSATFTLLGEDGAGVGALRKNLRIESVSANAAQPRILLGGNNSFGSKDSTTEVVTTYLALSQGALYATSITSSQVFSNCSVLVYGSAVWAWEESNLITADYTNRFQGTFYIKGTTSITANRDPYTANVTTHVSTINVPTLDTSGAAAAVTVSVDTDATLVLDSYVTGKGFYKSGSGDLVITSPTQGMSTTCSITAGRVILDKIDYTIDTGSRRYRVSGANVSGFISPSIGQWRPAVSDRGGIVCLADSGYAGFSAVPQDITYQLKGEVKAGAIFASGAGTTTCGFRHYFNAPASGTYRVSFSAYVTSGSNVSFTGYNLDGGTTTNYSPSPALTNAWQRYTFTVSVGSAGVHYIGFIGSGPYGGTGVIAIASIRVTRDSDAYGATGAAPLVLTGGGTLVVPEGAKTFGGDVLFAGGNMQIGRI